MASSVASVLVVTRFEVPEADADGFLEQARTALAAFAAREGYLAGRIGRAADDPSAWVMTTEWTGVGAYRRSLSSYDVKVDAAPLLSRGRNEPSAFEILVRDGVVSESRRAVDADTVALGDAAGPAIPS
jgi:quinol monooxygenase YgiN